MTFYCQKCGSALTLESKDDQQRFVCQRCNAPRKS
ncbi:MAG: zinc ribbon domain-containing protein [Rhodospirillales bacterium]|nr:zinc ribbon domain-containing protein [Rhodospirillales bacterium]